MPVLPRPSGSLSTRAIDLLIVNGPMHRAALAEQAGWARSTTSRVIGELVADGFVVETDIVMTGSRGRPHRLLTLNPDAGCTVGIDFGYRHIRAVVADAAHRIRAIAVGELEVDYPPETGVRVAGELVGEALSQARLPDDALLGAGAAVPAPIDRRTGRVSHSSMIPTWAGRDVAADLRHVLNLPVTVGNDAKLAAAAETYWGAGQGYGAYLFLKLHSGVGGALVLGGTIVDGGNGSAGEFGHVGLDLTGPVCRCGARGCLEVYAGIPAILEALRPAHGLLTLAQATRLLEAGDPAARRVFREAAGKVGQTASLLCNAFNPDAIIIGGALARASEHLIPEIKNCIRTLALPTNHNVAVLATNLGPEASAMGAVRLAFTQLANRTPHPR
jgi:predicted NBD/HSP70 family sugar kinase